MKASDVREWAERSLASEKSWGVGDCGRPYYIIGGKEVKVTREFRGAMRGAYVGFDRLEDGRVMAWFDRTCYDLEHEAGKMARAIDRWNKTMLVSR